MKCNICPYCVTDKYDAEVQRNHICPKCHTEAHEATNDEKICWFCGFDYNKKSAQLPVIEQVWKGFDWEEMPY